MKTKTKERVFEQVISMVPTCFGDFGETMRSSGIDPDNAAVIYHYMCIVGERMRNDKSFAPTLKREDRWRPVQQEVLKTILANDYTIVREQLVKHGYLEIRTKVNQGKRTYVPGKLTFAFKIPDSVYGGKENYEIYQPYICKSKKIRHGVARRWMKSRKEMFEYLRSQSELVRPEHVKVVSYFREFEINLQGLENDFNAGKFSRKTYRRLLAQAVALNQGELDHAKVEEYGRRLHYPITSLHTELRPYLRLCDKPNVPFVLLDFKNSQPYIISCILKQPDIIAQYAPEFYPITEVARAHADEGSTRMFHLHCSEGHLYNFLAHRTGLTATNYEKLPAKVKETIKDMLFKLVLYNRPFDPERTRRTTKNSKKHFAHSNIKSMYPGPWQAIYDLKNLPEWRLPWFTKIKTKKGTSYAKMFSVLNCLAARFESAVVFKVIVNRAAEQGIKLLTVHDAFVVEARHRAALEQIIHDFFKCELKVLPPTLSVQDVNKCDNNKVKTESVV